MKQFYKILFWLLFYVGCILFVGLLTLSIDVATRETILLALIGSFGLGFGIRKSNWITLPPKLYIISAIGFLFYIIVGLLFSINNWYVGPVACFIAYTSGFVLANKKYFLVYTLLIGCAFFYYAFAWYPQKSKIDANMYYVSSSIDLSDTALIWKDSTGKNRMSELSNQVVLIETWNEYCGNCFSGMRDLHPFLKEQEKLYKNFKHIYLYTRPLRVGETTIGVERTFKNKWLPYSDMFILQDENQAFYKKYLPAGFPHYILINQDGKVLFSFQGYQKKFKPAYQNYIAKQLKKAFQNNS